MASSREDSNDTLQTPFLGDYEKEKKEIMELDPIFKHPNVIAQLDGTSHAMQQNRRRKISTGKLAGAGYDTTSGGNVSSSFDDIMLTFNNQTRDVSKAA